MLYKSDILDEEYKGNGNHGIIILQNIPDGKPPIVQPQPLRYQFSTYIRNPSVFKLTQKDIQYYANRNLDMFFGLQMDFASLKFLENLPEEYIPPQFEFPEIGLRSDQIINFDEQEQQLLQYGISEEFLEKNVVLNLQFQQIYFSIWKIKELVPGTCNFFLAKPYYPVDDDLENLWIYQNRYESKKFSTSLIKEMDFNFTKKGTISKNRLSKFHELNDQLRIFFDSIPRTLDVNTSVEISSDDEEINDSENSE